MERTCKKCGETKPIEEFYKTKTNKGGFSPNCKLCIANSQKIYYSLNKEKRRECKKQYYLLNRNKILEKSKEYGKLYRNKNKDKINIRQKRWYIFNKEREIKRRKLNKERHNQTERIRNKLVRGRLLNNYVLKCISQTYGLNISFETIKQYPELIESYRQQIKLKRLLKQKKHENTETS